MDRLTAHNLPKVGTQLTVEQRALVAAAIIRIRATEDPMRNWYLYRYPAEGVPTTVRMLKFDSKKRLAQAYHIHGNA